MRREIYENNLETVPGRRRTGRWGAGDTDAGPACVAGETVGPAELHDARHHEHHVESAGVSRRTETEGRAAV